MGRTFTEKFENLTQVVLKLPDGYQMDGDSQTAYDEDGRKVIVLDSPDSDRAGDEKNKDVKNKRKSKKILKKT